MIYRGKFERTDSDSAPIEGEGSVTFTPSGLRIQSFIMRSGLIAGLSGCLAVIVMSLVVAMAMLLLGEHNLVTERSLRQAVTIGTVVLIGAFLGARALLSRVMPHRPFDRVIPLSNVVSSSVENGLVSIACTAPACTGRIRFRTSDPTGLARAIAHAKQS